MPVQKFRSVEDLGRAPILPTRGEGFERFVRHCARYRVLALVSALATARQRHDL